MMDYYLEFLFPEKHIRYIAVTENEDTEKGLSDFVPFKNLFNEWYAKDTSRKVKTALHAKFADGQFICAYAPLGYKKNPDVRNALVIDNETEWIIRKIFDLAVHGAGAAKITKQLIAEKVPTPGWIHYRRDGTFANIYTDAPEEKSYAWTIAQVKSILHDEIYIGNSVHGKQTTISYKNKKVVRKPEDEWFRVEHTHEAIIGEDVFRQVQEQTKARRRRMKDADTQIFAGLLKCADCGWSMSFGTNRQNSKPYSYFNCTKYRQYGKTAYTCSVHYIRYDTLYTYVLSRIQYWTERAQVNESALLKQILDGQNTNQKAEMQKKSAMLSKAEKRMAEVNILFAKLYEDRVSEKISEHNFTLLSQKYQTEQEELQNSIAALQNDLAAGKQAETDAEKWVSLVRQYSAPTDLTAEMLNALIEKIVIHEAVKQPDGTRMQEIEIYYRFIGKIE